MVAGQTIPNLVTVAVGAGNKVTLYNSNTGTINLIAGYYTHCGQSSAGSRTADRVLGLARDVGLCFFGPRRSL